MRFHIVPTYLAALRDLLHESGALILDGELIREMYGVGRHGCRVSPEMEKDLRARGMELWPRFSIRSQHDVVLVYQQHADPARLEALQHAVLVLQSRSPLERARGCAPGDVEGAVAMVLYLQMRMFFIRRIAGDSAA